MKLGLTTSSAPAHDHFRLLGEDNYRRYLPVEPLRIRVHHDDSLSDVFCRALAARAAGCRATISVPPSLSGPAADAVDLLDRLTDSWAGAIEFVEEDDASRRSPQFALGQVARVRLCCAGASPSDDSSCRRRSVAVRSRHAGLATWPHRTALVFTEQSVSHCLPSIRKSRAGGRRNTGRTC